MNTYYNINLEVAAMESTPKDEAEESLYGKVYGFFKHVGHKIKDAFQCVYDWFGWIKLYLNFVNKVSLKSLLQP